MKKLYFSAGLASLTLAAVVYASEPIKVFIAPEAYYVGTLKSALATPIVDELVRIKPEEVLIVACHETPPSRIIQFQVEMKARYKGKLQMMFEKICPVA